MAHEWYIVMDVGGSTYDEKEWPPERFSELLALLDSEADDEHPDIAITSHPDKWSLSLSRNGSASLERFKPRSRYRINNLSRDEMLSLARRFAKGGAEAIKQDSWEIRL